MAVTAATTPITPHSTSGKTSETGVGLVVLIWRRPTQLVGATVAVVAAVAGGST